MKTLLSIIVPMYNVENYLIDCIGNIKIEDTVYEIIMVNDGSLDNSFKIAESLSLTNSKIKIISQENKGLGGARNAGINAAIGKYILFLDADDVLNKQSFAFLEHSEEDIIEFSAQLVMSSGKLVRDVNKVDCASMSGKSYAVNIGFEPSACNKVYKKDFLINNNLNFKEKIYSEDIHFNSRAYFLADSVKSNQEIIQKFTQTMNSITRNSDMQKKQKMFDDLMFIFKDINDFKKHNVSSNGEVEYFNSILSDLGVGLINYGFKYNKDISEVFNILKREKIINKRYHLDLRKNLYRYLLLMPFSNYILKQAYKVKK